jgi:type IV pilus assembly protein PilB
MSIVVEPKRSDSNLFTIPTYKRNRSVRLQKDLDRSFIEVTTQQQAIMLGYQYIDLYGFPIDTSHLIIIPKEDVEKYRLGVFSRANKTLFVISDDYNIQGQELILNKLLENGFTVKKFLGSYLSINKLLETFNQVVVLPENHDDINIEESKINKIKSSITTLSEFSKLLDRVSMSDFVETVLVGALENSASDIHFEPEKDSYNLRFRLDGILTTFAHLPNVKKKLIENRIKIISGVKINVDNVPQDGRFSFKYNNRDIDVRVSLLPSNYGYSIVMRLLGTGDINLAFDSLGFRGRAKESLEWAIKKPQGLILTTGPTGSGKTTTLYTILNTLNDGENKIITLEDPIEYKLAGVSQTQMNSEEGYTFASGLRSVLRQDPDIVMVGEVRDSETSDVAIQAALTGHQVLSTIHTNDAAGAIPRLMEMGVKGFILADAISVIIGQRLVRKICPFCKEYHDISQNSNILELVLNQIEKLPESIKSTLPDEISFFKSKGCSKCNNTGYKGRVGVYEVMTISDSIRELVSISEPSIVQIKNAASSDGMISMLQDGILKCLDGITDIEELLKNVQ